MQPLRPSIWSHDSNETASRKPGALQQVDASAVPDEAIWSLGAYYVPIVTGIYLVMLAVLMNYNISRESHEENLRELKMRAAASSPESPKYDAHPDAGSDGKGAAAGK